MFKPQIKEMLDALQELAQVGGGVAIPGVVQGTWRCDTEGCGLWAW